MSTDNAFEAILRLYEYPLGTTLDYADVKVSVRDSLTASKIVYLVCEGPHFRVSRDMFGDVTWWNGDSEVWIERSPTTQSIHEMMRALYLASSHTELREILDHYLMSGSTIITNKDSSFLDRVNDFCFGLLNDADLDEGSLTVEERFYIGEELRSTFDIEHQHMVTIKKKETGEMFVMTLAPITKTPTGVYIIGEDGNMEKVDVSHHGALLGVFSKTI